MENTISSRLSTLGHPQRLAVFRLLMRRYPDRVPASELAHALGLKANTLSAYVGALLQAGLVTQERVGTSLRYGADISAAHHTIDYLMNDCCRGRPEICATEPAGSQQEATAMQPYSVLFICSGNSARSIFAEALLRSLGGARFVAHSAGTQPRSALNPFALDVLTQKGHDIAELRAKHVSEFQGAGAPLFDFVFTVCDAAANEECPAWSGQPISAHWGLPDPVCVTGTDAEKSLAFQQTYGALRNRLTAFTNLPFGSLDRLSLQKAVDDLGQMNDEGPLT